MSKYIDNRAVGKEGYLYVMSYPYSRSKHKIGYTLKYPTERAKEIKYRQKLLSEPVVEYYVVLENPWEIEQQAHFLIRQDRINGYNIGEGKEWFNCSVERAIWSIKKSISIKRSKHPEFTILGEYYSHNSYKELVINYTNEKIREERELKKKEIEMHKKLEEFRKQREAEDREFCWLILGGIILLCLIFG